MVYIEADLNFRKWVESIFGQAITPEEIPSSANAVKADSGAFPRYDLEGLPHQTPMKRKKMKKQVKR